MTVAVIVCFGLCAVVVAGFIVFPPAAGQDECGHAQRDAG
jgi:hypothetical protein